MVGTAYQRVTLSFFIARSTGSISNRGRMISAAPTATERR